ncbi:uncharacterized protein LOC105220225 [Zeugodacus cucurbitae]|uniref:uncharacterized protein LOC105220225 n=1 Tax=Zeugodacus cucurbitae TaxID=28588 RepID=UPI00059682E8|nr:uncharacterized protein LOC105220225 [Zeugodacus cucurbitae]
MIAILKEILDNQKEFSAKVQSLEQNQKVLFQKIVSLYEGQETIAFNQGLMSRQLEGIENKSLDKSGTLAQSSLPRECKISINNIEQSVSLMTGESKDSALDEVASLLPIQSLEAILEVE